MAGTVNKVILIGHTGEDVKMKYFEGGNCIGKFPLATNEEYTNRNTGQRVSNTEWHNCVVRNKAAEICEKYLKKGDKVYVEGRIKTRQWTDDSNQKRYITEIQVQEFTFLTPKNESSPAGNSQPSSNQQQPSHQQNQGIPVGGDDEDDLPF